MTLKYDTEDDDWGNEDDDFCTDASGTYEVCVLNSETYTVQANNEEEAKIQALDYFRDDDLWYGSEEAENATIEDCEIIDFEED